MLAQGASGLISNLIASKISENRGLAERNHLIRLGPAEALRDALIEACGNVESRGNRSGELVPAPSQEFFDIWLGQFSLALDPQSDAAIAEGLFPLRISEVQ